MTETQNSLYPDEWKKTARKDWHRVSVLLNDNDPEGAAFFLQQTLEKYLKAFLLERGWKLRKIHDLDTLLDEAIQFDAGLEKFRELCERVTGYYYTERYPGLIPTELTSNDIESDKTAAQAFIQSLFASEPAT
jgi:HEPN domain-containing protein